MPENMKYMHELESCCKALVHMLPTRDNLSRIEQLPKMNTEPTDCSATDDVLRSDEVIIPVANSTQSMQSVTEYAGQGSGNRMIAKPTTTTNCVATSATSVENQ